MNINSALRSLSLLCVMVSSGEIGQADTVYGQTGVMPNGNSVRYVQDNPSPKANVQALIFVMRGVARGEYRIDQTELTDTVWMYVPRNSTYEEVYQQIATVFSDKNDVFSAATINIPAEANTSSTPRTRSVIAIKDKAGNNSYYLFFHFNDNRLNFVYAAIGDSRM